MKTAMKQTSMDAFYGNVSALQAQEKKVIEAMCRSPENGLTRTEIATVSGIPINAVCGRVNRLVQIGVIEELDRRRCTVTGNAAHPVRIAPVQRTLGLDAA